MVASILQPLAPVLHPPAPGAELKGHWHSRHTSSRLSSYTQPLLPGEKQQTYFLLGFGLLLLADLLQLEGPLFDHDVCDCIQEGGPAFQAEVQWCLAIVSSSR